jgi:hypothetical protein
MCLVKRETGSEKVTQEVISMKWRLICISLLRQLILLMLACHSSQSKITILSVQRRSVI